MSSFVSQFSVRNEVMATSHVTDEWMTQMEMSSLNTYIVRRYIATPNGVLRIYPGSLMDKAFDPTRRQWWVLGASIIKGFPPQVPKRHDKTIKQLQAVIFKEDTSHDSENMFLNHFLNVVLTKALWASSVYNAFISSLKFWDWNTLYLAISIPSGLIPILYAVCPQWVYLMSLRVIMASNDSSYVTYEKWTHVNWKTLFYFWDLFLLWFSKAKASQVV